MANKLARHFSALLLLTSTVAGHASVPEKILPDGKTTASSVASEVTYFTGKDQPLLNAVEIERQGGYRSSEILHDAWSDSYWNDIQGGIAAPYHDGSALGSFFPFGNYNVLGHYNLFFRTHGAAWGAAVSMSEAQIARLSPAEKYDLLVGDENFTLTRTVWEQIAYLHKNEAKLGKNGQFVFDESGKMVYVPKGKWKTPFWQGICNGWAAAALNLDRPGHSFILTNARGQRIKFYPADVRALASQLWARSGINNALDGAGPDAKPVIRHSGYRCAEANVRRDFWSRRPKNPACNDVNPAVWHLAIVNRVGADRQGIIFDEKIEKEVWNHPVIAYSYRYFDWTTGRSGNLKDLLTGIERARYTSRNRAPGTRWLVGVEMKVTFLKNIDAEVSEVSNKKRDDEVSTVTYFYDLEMDENMNVIGGEWLFSRPFSGMGMEGQERVEEQMNHPDFIWAPLPGWKAFAEGDRFAGYGTWDGNGEVPEAVRAGAVRSSQLSQPLAEVVDLLIARSRE